MLLLQALPTSIGVAAIAPALLVLWLVIAGALWDITGPQGTFLAGAGFALVALAGLLMVRGKIGKYTAA